MATTGTSNNNAGFLKNAGTVGNGLLTNVSQGSGPRIYNPTPSDDGRILPRDSEFRLGDRSFRKSNPGQLYYSHLRLQAASGYKIDGTPIEAAVATTTTFATDTTLNDDGRLDAGAWTIRRSNNITSNSYPLKVN